MRREGGFGEEDPFGGDGRNHRVSRGRRRPDSGAYGRAACGGRAGLGALCDFDVVQLMNIDSTNMRPAEWIRLASEIAGAYDDYDGFVVLHGTDTMAYTAAALSYLVQGDKTDRPYRIAASHGGPLHGRSAERLAGVSLRGGRSGARRVRRVRAR